eukprot:g81891.t1
MYDEDSNELFEEHKGGSRYVASDEFQEDKAVEAANDVDVPQVPPRGDVEIFNEEKQEEKGKPDVWSGVWNLANYIVGAGVLALPYACVKAGLILGMFLIGFVCIGVHLSFKLLLWSSELSERYTYEDLARFCVGKRFANVVKVVIIIDNLGPLSAYTNIVGEAAVLFLSQHVKNPNSLWVRKGWLTFIQLVLIVFPMCFIKDISKLGFTSLLSLLPLVYIMILQFVTFVTHGVGENVVMFAPNVFLALPIVVFAFSCQQVMPPIYKEFREQGGSIQDISKAVRGALALSLISYVWVGLFGYLQYGGAAKDNILSNFPQNASSNVLWLTMAGSILLSYPVIVFPCRISVDRLFFPEWPYSYRRFVLENMGIVTLAFVIAIAIPQLSTLLGIFGALTSTLIGYILPPLYFLRINHQTWREDSRRIAAYSVLSSMKWHPNLYIRHVDVGFGHGPGRLTDSTGQAGGGRASVTQSLTNYEWFTCSLTYRQYLHLRHIDKQAHSLRCAHASFESQKTFFKRLTVSP